MSEKLPVGDVLNEVFQFGLHRWGTVLRFAWLPLALVIGLALAYAYALIDISALKALEANGGELESFGEIFRVPVSVAIVAGLGFYLVVFVLMSGVSASVYRLVALGEDRPGLFHLRLDGPTWRVFWAYVVLFIINLAIWASAAIIAFSLTHQSFGDVANAMIKLFEFAAQAENGAQPSPEMVEPFAAAFGAFMLAGLLALIPLLYVNIKLAAFLPGSAAENRLLLLGSFRMTFGYFWSILGAYILFIIFVVIIAIIIEVVLMIVKMLAGFLAAQVAGLAIIGVVMKVLLFAAIVLYQVFMMALQFAMPAVIYRRLKTGA